MKEAVENLIQEVISLTGLSISPGCGSDDCELGWSGRRIDGIPKNFFAQARICVNELVSGFFIKVMAYGYDLLTHHDGFSELYWGRTIDQCDLDSNKEELIREIRDAIVKAWDDLPLLYQKMLVQKEQQKELFEQLRREGKLIE